MSAVTVTEETPASPVVTPRIIPSFRVERSKTDATERREKVLYDLAEQAADRGMTIQEWSANQAIGPCRSQVEIRISQLYLWLLQRPATN